MASLHFLTLRNKYRFPLALIASLLLHSLPWLLNQIPPPKPPLPPKPSLTATLAPQALPAPVAPPPPALILPEPPKPETRPPPAPPKPEKQKPRENPLNAPKTWNLAIAQQLKSLKDRQEYYPQEAISQGLQGEVLVLVIIDENGNITAARVEESSGHRLLDEAALRNVRTIRSLPADAPRQALLPLRFKLH